MKKLISILIGIASVVGVQAQDMKALFVSMPDSIAPLVRSADRTEEADRWLSVPANDFKKQYGNEIATIEWFGENRMYGEYSVCIRLW